MRVTMIQTPGNRRRTSVPSSELLVPVRPVARADYPSAMTGEHDPGPERASARAADVVSAASEPIEVRGGGTVRIGTASWTDPTMTASGVFYPAGADSAEERLH